jgi:hypothetical protein
MHRLPRLLSNQELAMAKPQAKVHVPAAERLREVEDKWLGETAPRTPDGKVERGHGSFYQRMSPERRRHHAALEAAAASEAKVAVALAALAAAELNLAEDRDRIAATWVP